jgi:hypothetical protein
MNIINNCTVHYITASRTIETVSLKNTDRIFYIYNYEGNHFRVFTEILDLIRFFQFGTEPNNSFSNENELDDFLVNFNFRRRASFKNSNRRV